MNCTKIAAKGIGLEDGTALKKTFGHRMQITAASRECFWRLNSLKRNSSNSSKLFANVADIAFAAQTQPRVGASAMN